MNVLIVTDYKGAWPYIPELKENLVHENIKVDILDIGDLNLIGYGGTKTVVRDEVKYFLSIPLLNIFIRIFALKLFLRRIKIKYDVLNIHFAAPLYIFLIKELNKIAHKKMISVWGSDFYRVSNFTRNKEQRLFDFADIITFINPQTLKDFTAYYKNYGEKSFVIRFGLESIEIIKKVRAKESLEKSKESLGIPADSFIIVCGYNSSQAQQHEIIIKALMSLKENLPPNTLIIFPMTYPQNNEYINKIEGMLKKSSLKYKIFRTMMNIKDVARLRLITDVVINVQTTDQLSASIQEHLFAGNIVITGKWLPYDIYDEMKVFFLRVEDLNDLREKVLDCILNYKKMTEKCFKNSEIIYDFASWKNNKNIWTDFYHGLLET